MNRRTALIIAGSVPLLAACLYDQYFDIEWDEEVLLHDGRVIVVHVKRTYERRGKRLRPYEDVTFRRNEFTFDAGDPVGLVKFSSRLGVGLIDQVNGNWYAVLFGQGPYGNYPEEMPDHWGQDFTVQEERLAKLERDRFVPIAWDAAPPGALLNNNFVVGSMSVKELSDFDGKKMTLGDKKRLRDAYPPGPGGGKISRPIRMQKPKEELK